jgi:hypothetical protein
LEQVASPLSELLSYISQQVHAQPVPTQINQGTSLSSRESRPESGSASNRIRRAPELKSVAYFRNEWSKLSTEQQLTQTLAQAPENAGPMNSQHLVLRSLERMRDIAPDYLQGFMSYIDTLIWLEHADPTKKSIRDFSAVDKESKTRTKRSAPSRGKS